MSDIFREVEEDVRREKLQKFWKSYGDYVIALGAVVIVGIAGFQLWQRYQQTERDKASVAFIAAQRITDPKAAAVAFADIAKSAPKGYALLARLEQAHSMLASGQKDGALAIYKDVATQDKGGPGAVALLRQAWAVADTTPRTDLESLLTPLREPSSAWKQMADEVLAYSDYHNNQMPKAAQEFEALANDANAPGQLRVRARAMAAFLKQGGAKDFGTVPPLAPPPAPSAIPAPPAAAASAPAGAPATP
ncbi:MAG TPA: tetratricopeptide repeat protein [Rhizomicrobium sp.]